VLHCCASRSARSVGRGVPTGAVCRVTGVSTFVSVTITSLTRLRALHADTSPATTLTGAMLYMAFKRRRWL
jgi:hypothetical protein